MKKVNLLIVLFFSLFSASLQAQQGNDRIEKVYIIFKTHLDIGFTDLSSKVEQRYIDEFIPKAIAVAQELRSDGGEARYVWTTGSWLVQAYLDQAAPAEAKALEEAIDRGDIAWNGMPYTVQTESMTKELLETVLKLSNRLDERFGKKTTAAKMTDVPGHTRGIVSALSDAGIRFLQIGVNSSCMVPGVPPICRWRNPADGKEVILMYQSSYGEEMLFPDGKKVVAVKFTGDNHGPHTADDVRGIFAELHQKYPQAELIATSLNEVANELYPMSGMLPIITSEIGDTWIYGYASEPVRMAKYRELMRLYSQWLQEGKIDMNSAGAIAFAVRLGMIAEHTWGCNVNVYLRNWDKYDVDIFRTSRNLPEFKIMEQSWQEKTDNIEKAIALLPAKLQAEAHAAIKGIGEEIKPLPSTTGNKSEEVANNISMGEVDFSCTLSYQTYSGSDYEDYRRAYSTDMQWWTISDFGKPGFEDTQTQSAVIAATLQKRSETKNKLICQAIFPADERIDQRVLPEEALMEYITHEGNKSMDINVSLLNKPANRMPEAYWLSFNTPEIVSVVLEKLGCRIDAMDVVVGGGRQMHGIDRYVDIVTSAGTIRITSLDALLVALGRMNAIGYSPNPPILEKGVHFCLFNNAWGTNFTQWFEGSITYRFKVEILRNEI